MIDAKEAYKLSLEKLEQIDSKQRERAEEFVEKTLVPLINSAIEQGKFYVETKLSLTDEAANNLAAIRIIVQSKGYKCTYTQTRSAREEFIILNIKWC